MLREVPQPQGHLHRVVPQGKHHVKKPLQVYGAFGRRFLLLINPMKLCRVIVEGALREPCSPFSVVIWSHKRALLAMSKVCSSYAGQVGHNQRTKPAWIPTAGLPSLRPTNPLA